MTAAQESRADLPEFRSHGFDSKFVALTEADMAPGAHLRQFIGFIEAYLGRRLRGAKVLDLGCGRGELVAGLRAAGARAFGVEVDSRFVDSGRILETLHRDDYPILSTADGKGRSLFPDGFFDLVVSDQVLEHVADLDNVAEEIARVLAPGGQTVHMFPAHRRVVEVHYRMPFVHWLPKNGLRKSAIRAFLRAGFSRQFFPDRPLDQRTEIINTYANEETFYRPLREIADVFARRGIEPTYRQALKAFVASRIPAARPFAGLIAPAIGTFRMAVFAGVKR